MELLDLDHQLLDYALAFRVYSSLSFLSPV